MLTQKCYHYERSGLHFHLKIGYCLLSVQFYFSAAKSKLTNLLNTSEESTAAKSNKVMAIYNKPNIFVTKFVVSWINMQLQW